MLREEFLPYLAEAVTPLLSALSTDAEIRLSNAPDAELAKGELEAAGLTAMSMDLRGAGRQVFGVNTSLMQAKESACKTLYQYTEDLGEGFAPHAAQALAVVLPNLGPRNAVPVQVVSAAIVPKLVGLADRRAAGVTAAAAGVAGPAAGEAQNMLDASVDALTEVVSRLSGGDGDDGPLEQGDQERACVTADALGTLLEGRCDGGGQGGLLCVSDERLARTATVLRDVATASIRRTRARYGSAAAAPASGSPLAGGVGGMTGAVDAAELQELEDGEEELLVSVVDAVGWMIKGRKDAFLPTFEAVLRPLVIALLDTNAGGLIPPSHRSFGLCMAIDVLEHAGEGGRKSIFPAPLLPALLQGCGGVAAGAGGGMAPSTSTKQASAYGLGVAAEFGGPEFDEHSAEALRLLLALVEEGGKDDDAHEDDDVGDDGWKNGAVTDNAISAAFRVLFARQGPVCAAFGGGAVTAAAAGASGPVATPVTAIVGSLLDALPITVDVAEGQVCHRRVVDLTLSRNDLFFAGTLRGGGAPGAAVAATATAANNAHAAVIVPKLVTAIAGMIEYQPSHEELEDAAEAGAELCGAGLTVSDPGSQGNSQYEEMWERQLVDRETRQKVGECLAFLTTSFPKFFEEAWAGLDEERRQALQKL